MEFLVEYEAKDASKVFNEIEKMKDEFSLWYKDHLCSHKPRKLKGNKISVEITGSFNNFCNLVSDPRFLDFRQKVGINPKMHFCIIGTKKIALTMQSIKTKFNSLAEA